MFRRKKRQEEVELKAKEAMKKLDEAIVSTKKVNEILAQNNLTIKFKRSLGR